MSIQVAGAFAAITGLFLFHALATGRVVVAINIFYGGIRVRRNDNSPLYWLATIAWGALFAVAVVTLAEGLVPGFDMPPLQPTG